MQCAIVSVISHDHSDKTEGGVDKPPGKNIWGISEEGIAEYIPKI